MERSGNILHSITYDPHHHRPEATHLIIPYLYFVVAQMKERAFSPLAIDHRSNKDPCISPAGVLFL
jgi:hypothetical protein